MRITGGTLKGRALITPPKKEISIRPLRSRIRKALFDVLGENLAGFLVLDLFAGTGALGIEALSRGAHFAIFVDNNSLSLNIIQKNLEKLGLKEKAKILKLTLPEEINKITALVKNTHKKFDLIFITPPYGKGLAEKTLQQLPSHLYKDSSTVVVEERSTISLNIPSEKFICEKKKTYGETTLYFLKPVKSK
ncbi:MAG: 16S rRNA (guanine(966)-N(2))-methyltransferase RsmD [Caldimicrobium sp.]